MHDHHALQRKLFLKDSGPVWRFNPIWLQQAAECLNRLGSIVTVASVNPCLSLSGLVTRDLTIRGSLWFERSDPGRLVDMIADGALKVDKIKSQAFSLDNVADALQTAALGSTPFEQVVVNPN